MRNRDARALDPRRRAPYLRGSFQGPPMTPDPHRDYKSALSRYATGVTVVGVRGARDEPLGLTVNSFASVSLEPRLVLWCVEKKAALYEAFMAAGAYAVSVLTRDAEATSTRFATHGGHDFRPEEVATLETGAPLLARRLAGFDCRIAERVEAGDHVILLGEVVAFDRAEGAPLLYVNSGYSGLEG